MPSSTCVRSLTCLPVPAPCSRYSAYSWTRNSGAYADVGIGATALPHTCLSCKVDIRVIQVLLGHKKLYVKSLYAQVATDLLRSVISPLDPPPQAPGTK